MSSEAIALEPAAEIAQLHSEICDAIRTNLDKAIRCGELLAGIKAGLEHGEWLPWLKANIPFAETTARNYMRVFENRDRLKSASVADLTEGYRLLAAPCEPETRQETDHERISKAFAMLAEVNCDPNLTEQFQGWGDEERAKAIASVREAFRIVREDLILRNDLIDSFHALLAIFGLCESILCKFRETETA